MWFPPWFFLGSWHNIGDVWFESFPEEFYDGKRVDNHTGVVSIHRHLHLHATAHIDQCIFKALLFTTSNHSLALFCCEEIVYCAGELAFSLFGHWQVFNDEIIHTPLAVVYLLKSACVFDLLLEFLLRDESILTIRLLLWL